MARLKKSKILIICLENPLREIYSKKLFQSLKKLNVPEKMGKHENSGFHPINYAKNILKLTNFSVLVRKEDVS